MGGRCYAVSGTSQATRSKRRLNMRAQKLRAAAALLAEWFRICVRQSYLGSHPTRNTNEPVMRDGGAKPSSSSATTEASTSSTCPTDPRRPRSGYRATRTRRRPSGAPPRRTQAPPHQLARTSSRPRGDTPRALLRVRTATAPDRRPARAPRTGPRTPKAARRAAFKLMYLKPGNC